jgi:adenosylcobyric acid synthase
MNPVLIKPEGDAGSQVVVMGRPWRAVRTVSDGERKQHLWAQVTAALDRLRARHDLVVIEGAGSPAEINLRSRDIVNMAVALYANVPVLLVGDIDRGGVFASLVGTLVLLEERERQQVKGLVINKLHGDARLLQTGLDMLEARTHVPVLGVVPYLRGLHIAEEDAMALEDAAAVSPDGAIDIAVIRLPRISNFDEYDALSLEPGVHVRYVRDARELGRPDAVILPGTKHTLADLRWLCTKGLDRRIVDLARQGVAVVGICGGYQMLGLEIADPLGVESAGGERLDGLGLLPLATEFAAAKTTRQVRAETLSGPGFLALAAGTPVAGYEIHMGHATQAGGSPLFRLSHRQALDGAIDPAGRVWGTYLHGIFDNTAFRRAWLRNLGWSPPDEDVDLAAIRQAAYDRLAAAVRASLDMSRLRQIVGLEW